MITSARLQVKETKECLFRVTSPIRKIQQSVKICEEAESQVKQMNENINYKKDEYNANADKLQVSQDWEEGLAMNE